MVKLYDDGGSFDKILREAEEAANGDETLKLRLLTEKIVKDFVDKLMQESEAKRRAALESCFDQIHNSGKEEEEDVIRKPKRQKRKRKGNPDVQEQVPELPESFRKRIQRENGKDVVLVMQKHITASDLKKNLNRLSIPKNQIRADDFINEEEKKILEDKKKLPIEVLLIPPSLKENVKLNLKRWPMGNTFSYNLIHKWWSRVVKDADNRLELDSMIQLWRFRKNITDLCFALVKVEKNRRR